MAINARSWGHELLPLDDFTRERDENALAGRRTGGFPVDAQGHITSWHHEDRLDGEPKPEWTWCSVRCHNRREFRFRYSYVTGRAGRVSWADKQICRDHAEAAAKKYGIAMPEAANVV